MTDFATLDAVNQSAPTNFGGLDDRMLLKSDNTEMERKGDHILMVRFYMRPILDETESTKANRAIYRDQEHIHIKIPGDKYSEVNRMAFPEDRQRFPAHYAKFRSGQEQVVGTPLSVVPFLTESQVEEYKQLNIRTVEQLAGLADVNAQRILGSVAHKQKCQEFLDSLKSADAVRAEFATQFSAQQEQINDLQRQLREQLEAKQKSPQK